MTLLTSETVAIEQQNTQKNSITNKSAKGSVGCGVFQVGIVGSYFFDEGFAGVKEDSKRYAKMLSKLFGHQLLASF